MTLSSLGHDLLVLCVLEPGTAFRPSGHRPSGHPRGGGFFLAWGEGAAFISPILAGCLEGPSY